MEVTVKIDRRNKQAAPLIELLRTFSFVKITDEYVENSKIKSKKENEEKFKPFTMEEFNARIARSLEDSENGNLTEINDLIKEIEEWD
ncbi:MAG: hypothetical protein Q4G08_08160 [Capnocytophaga sp.]|nr:hypothetical protein [Capnocytophaga sp.]